MSDIEGVRLYPTDCPNLFVGRPVSMTVEGRAVAWHPTWYVYGRAASDFPGGPPGPIGGPLGMPRSTRAEARLYAEQVRCPDWDRGVHA